MTILACLLAASAVVATPLSRTLAPLVPAENAIDNGYIVMFKDGSHEDAYASHLNFLQAHNEQLTGPAGIKNIYDGHVKGYSGHFSESLVDKIRSFPEVAYVERDQPVYALNTTTQRGAPWGLARISHRKKLTFGSFSSYVHDPSAGEGVDVYVIDTGINIEHAEFEGRASWGKTVPQPDQDIDGNGHGTHCAGTIASRKYGVAKGAQVIAVKVLGTNGSGSMSDVVRGVEFAATSAVKKAKESREEFAATGHTKHKGSVANMSLGGGKSKALDDTVDKAVALGLHFAVAAGNDNRDACNYSPAASKDAVTVGATTITDERAYFSNHGSCVDVLAPGLNILSTWIGSTHATNTISGTSMASPHVAGLLAYLLSIYGTEKFTPELYEAAGITASAQRPMLTAYNVVHSALPTWATSFLPSPRVLQAWTGEEVAPATLTGLQLKKALIALTTEGAISDLPAGTPNKLIFNNATA